MKTQSAGHRGDKRTTQSTKIIGIISTISKGIGFIENPADPDGEDIVIEQGFLNTALNKDEVEVLLHAPRKDERQTGEVAKIIKRNKTTFVGTIELDRGVGFLIPDDRKMYIEIMLPAEEIKGIENGTKVQVEFVSWEDPKKNPRGKITKVLGKKGDNNVEMTSIVLEKGFDTSYPDAVLAEAEKIEKEQKVITGEEIAKRRDFRNTLTMTIDPVDAKDFDDAISFKKLPNGLYEIGVHIADVSHYVTEGSALDKEAFNRCFSVYLVDRTIPMLPEVLSNDVCSLNPNEEKLTFSGIFVMDIHGQVKERSFSKTVIKSAKRFSYEEAQGVLDAKSGQYFDELSILNTIAKKLQEEKFKNGAIEFDQEEIKFILDENGKPTGVYKKPRLDTHKLVEEYMLLANREVSKFIHDSIKSKKWKELGSLYRIHDVPNPEKVADLVIFLKAMGYVLPVKNHTLNQKDINALLKQVEGKAEESLIKTTTIRSMAKAIYSTKNIGHFGLAFDYYTHFTSPIRRYADLVIHRILFRHLQDKNISDAEVIRYEKIARQSSDREISASEAERASKKYKQVEYMQSHVGETFEGTISGVTEWGIYVEEVNTKCEGMVKLRDLGDDFYTLDEKNYAVVGEKSKKRFQLGDTIKFKVVSADLDRKTLDYALVK